jgi:hypothetical protein
VWSLLCSASLKRFALSFAKFGEGCIGAVRRAGTELNRQTIFGSLSQQPFPNRGCIVGHTEAIHVDLLAVPDSEPATGRRDMVGTLEIGYDAKWDPRRAARVFVINIQIVVMELD